VSLACCLAVALVIGSLQCSLSREKEVVGEEVATEVVEVGNTLRGREVSQGGRLRGDARKHLFSVAKLAALFFVNKNMRRERTERPAYLEEEF
jgi:hypothetical protein